jgi:hypothetical protein
VISKTKLVNLLFLLGFPVYGIGTYMMFDPSFSWTSGLFFSTLPFLAIIVFHVLDMVHQGRFTPHVNGTFWLGCAALLSIDASLFMGLRNNSPVLTPANSAVLAIQFTTPFLAAVIVQVYNRAVDGFDWAGMVLKGLLLFVAVNLLGVAAGMHNKLHSFEGRISLPFMLGIYEAAHVLSFLNLLLLFQLRDFDRKPLRFLGMLGLYLVNLAVIMSVNSRLSFMIFFVITVLFITKAVRAARGLYTISLFTMPLMMSFALLIYEILSLPFFTAILSRVDKKDVTTFNGRTYIWESAWDWVTTDQRGLLFGNGYNGQYRLRLLDHVAKLWNEPSSYNLHMHSAFLEIAVNQGLVGLGLMYLVYWRTYKAYRTEYVNNTAMAPLFGGFVYLLFVWQIDITGFGYFLGFMLLFMLLAPLCVRSTSLTHRRKDLSGNWLP